MRRRRRTLCQRLYRRRWLGARWALSESVPVAATRVGGCTDGRPCGVLETVLVATDHGALSETVRRRFWYLDEQVGDIEAYRYRTTAARTGLRDASGAAVRGPTVLGRVQCPASCLMSDRSPGVVQSGVSEFYSVVTTERLRRLIRRACAGGSARPFYTTLS